MTTTSKASAEPEPVVGTPVGEWAARVDDDIITWHELQSAVSRRYRELDPQVRNAPELREMLVRSVLDHLIDRSLVIQQARRNQLKNEKNWEMISRAALETFEQQQLPLLLEKYDAEDRYELERTLVDQGESLDEMIESHKLEFIFHSYLMNTVGSKISVDLPEMRTYYVEHRHHESFQHDDQLTWREIVVQYDEHPDRASARRKAEEAMARLRRGEDFAAVARTFSDGTNADQGGLWSETTPGSYAVSAVNDALASLRPGQISPIIEGPTALHIVRVESFRPAGPLTFAEAQDKIRDILRGQEEAELTEEYLDELYQGAVVTTVFKEYVPRHLRDDDAKR